MKFIKNINEIDRQIWLKKVLSNLPHGIRLLDAGAGELKNAKYCSHLNYVSQDISEYKGSTKEGLHTIKWDTSKVDIVSDITEIPEPKNSFDAILCSEVLEHIPEPTKALSEFSRLLKPGGKLILTAPFSSNVHMSPYFFCTGFSKYWYEHHLPILGFKIDKLISNGDWYSLLRQEISRLVYLEQKQPIWIKPLTYFLSAIGLLYFALRPKIKDQGLACFGWHCIATKK